MKVCRGCKKPKELSEFYRNRTRSDGYTSLCKTCFRAKYPRSSRPRYEVARRREQRHGITEAQYAELLEAQEGVCYICQEACATGKSLALDHCHETGKVRGLLCMSCNTGLGKFKDNPQLLQRAIQYLVTRHK